MPENQLQEGLPESAATAAAAVIERAMGVGQQKVNFVNTRFQNCLNALIPRRDRLFLNLDKYCGYQLDPEQIKKLDKARRVPIVMNLSKRKVQGLAAAIVKNIWDIDVLPMDGKRNTLMYAIQDMMKVDQSYSRWDYNFLMHIIYALISDSVMEMIFTNEIDPMGRIGWEVCQPGMVAYDPNWRTGVSKDLNFVFKYMKLTADQIMQLYPDQTERIQRNLLMDLTLGGNFDTPKISDYKDYTQSKTMNGQYDVVEYNYVVEEEDVVEVAINANLELPKTDDYQVKKDFVEANKIKYEDIHSIYQTIKKPKICTICPGIVPEQPLYDGYDIFQIKRLRFFPLASERIVGEPFGIMDVLTNMQDAINKLINNSQGIIDSAAHGGGAVNPEIVGNDDTKMEEIKKRWSDPFYKFFGSPAAFASGKSMFLPFPHNDVDAGIFNQLSKILYELNNDVLPLNPAAEGKSEHAGEPGILFNMKMQIIEQAQLVLMKNIENFLLEAGEAYVDAGKILYSKTKRTFYKNDGSEIVINDIKALPSGDIAIDNDLGSLQRCRIVVTLSPKSPNSQFTKRMTHMDVLNLLYKDAQNNIELIGMTQGKILETIPCDDEEEKIRAQMIERRNQLGKMRMDAMLNTPPGGAQQKPPTLAFRYADLEPEAKVQALKKIGIEVGSQQGQEPGQQQGQPQQPPHAEAQQKLQQNLQPLTAPQGASQTASPSQT
jgi:hypothetical protein